MDIEWAKDGVDGKLYILQARPETVHATHGNGTTLLQYHIADVEKKLSERILLTGISVGQQISTGNARVIHDASEIDQVQQGDIIVTDMTDPDWVPATTSALRALLPIAVVVRAMLP